MISHEVNSNNHFNFYLRLANAFLMCSYFFLDLVPLDFPIIKREHFNRHYSCFAYYLAFNLADAPLLIFNAIIFECIAHPMTEIPFELHRFLMLLVVAVTLSFAAQIFGMFCGSMNNIKVRKITHKIMKHLTKKNLLCRSLSSSPCPS